MKTILYTLLSLVMLSFVACSEDDVTPDLKSVITPFMPSADDTSEEAVARREFTQKYGSYLLFNDTLVYEESGRDINGDMHYTIELLDLSYEVGASYTSNEQFSFTLMTDWEAKKAAIEYIEDYLLVHLTGKLRPFSWLLVDKIQRTFTGSSPSTPYAATGQRSIAIACNLIPRLTDAQKTQFTAQVMNTVIGHVVADNSDAFTDFYKVSEAYYDGTFVKGAGKTNQQMLNEVGFIARGINEVKYEEDGLYPSRDIDIKSFARQVVAYSQERFETLYADYPLVLEKGRIMRATLKSLGYVE